MNTDLGRPAPNQKSGEPLRMLTLLINDIRSGVEDFQLAEVRVPMTEKEDCFWTNSLDVCEQLQKSPSRIDGVHGLYRLLHLSLTLTHRPCESVCLA